MKNKIYKIFKKLNLDNPLEYARKIVAPLCHEKLKEHISNCTDCRTCKNFCKSLPKGNPNANILIINDNAIDNEEINNYFNELLDCSGLDLNDIYVINAVSCVLKKDFNGEAVMRLPNRNEVKNCKYFVDYAIDFVKPRVIILMGATTLAMFDKKETLAELKGKYVDINGIKALVTYSAKDLYNMLDFMSEEEVTETANSVAQDINNVKLYIEKLERR